MVHHIYEANPSQFSAPHYDWVDGDYTKIAYRDPATLPRRTARERRLVELVEQATQIPREDQVPLPRRYRREVGLSGLPIDTTHLPTVMRPSRKLAQLPDYSQRAGATIVSAALRDIIESVEPDTHIFHPVRIVAKNGREYGTLYMLYVCNVLHAVHPDSPGWYLYKGYTWKREPVEAGSDVEPELVFDAAKVAGTHMWRDVQMPNHATMLSNTLAERIAAANFPTVGLTAYREV